MQITSWKFSDYVLLTLRGMIDGIVEQITREDAPGKIHGMQGKLEGLKLLRDKIITEFGPLEGSMDREDIPPGVDSIGKTALESFNQQILEDAPIWRRISEFITSCDEKESKNLYESSDAVTRDMKRAHGKRDGLRLAEKLMDEVTETLDYSKANPELPGLEDEEEGVIDFPTDGLAEDDAGEEDYDPGEESAEAGE